MPISLSDLQTPQTKEQIQETLTGFLVTLGFPVTAWQSEGAARSFLESMSELGASFTERVAAFSKSLDLETAEDEFLDVKARSDFDEERSTAVAAVFDTTFVNAGVTTYGPLAAGAIIVRSTSGQLFVSTGIETITASASTTVEVIAQIPGAAGNIGADTLQLVTPLAGVAVSTAGILTTAGADEGKDPELRTQCRTKWGTLRVEKVKAGTENLVLASSASIAHVTTRDDNPRGPGTADVLIAADGAASGAGDVTLAQTALDLAFLGNGTVDQLVQAVAATTTTLAITAEILVSGITEAEALATIGTATDDFLNDSPIGGFDLSPGPTNIITNGQIIDAITTIPGVISVNLTVPAADTTVLITEKILATANTYTIVVVSSS